MNKEENLIFAIRNYPPGTQFQSCTGRILVVKGASPVFIGEDGRISIETTEFLNTTSFNGSGAVIRFSNGDWAKIIYKPKINYEIY